MQHDTSHSLFFFFGYSLDDDDAHTHTHDNVGWTILGDIEPTNQPSGDITRDSRVERDRDR